MLSIADKALFENRVISHEYHSHSPYDRNFRNNDEIRIHATFQDVIATPFESFLHITGTLSGKKADGSSADVKFTNNPVAHIFDSVMYQINGRPLDSVRTLGIATTLKGILSIQNGELNRLQNAGWTTPGNKISGGNFSFCVPLRLLLGFAEDYKKMITGGRHELILLRAPSDVNAVISPDAVSISLTISNIYWRVPHLVLAEEPSAELMEMTRAETKVEIPFRQWSVYELPALPKSTLYSWSIKTSSQLEKPRYVVLAFQTGRRNDLTKDMSCFDHCDLQEVKLYLNSSYYPYENIQGDQSIFYEMFCRFQSAYYGKKSEPAISYSVFKEKVPLYVIDCSYQEDALKSGPVDVRLEMRTGTAFSENTTAYCLIIHDQHMLYELMSATLSSAL